MRWKENDYSRKYDSTPRDPPDLPNTPKTDPVRLATIVRARNRQTSGRGRGVQTDGGVRPEMGLEFGQQVAEPLENFEVFRRTRCIF